MKELRHVYEALTQFLELWNYARHLKLTQKNVRPIFFWTNNIFWPQQTILFMPQPFVLPKCLWPEPFVSPYFFNPKSFRTKFLGGQDTFSGHIFFWLQQFFCHSIHFLANILSVIEFSLASNCFDPKRILATQFFDQHFFGPNSWAKKYFWLQNIYDHNLYNITPPGCICP